MKKRIIYFSLSLLCFIICYIIVRSFSHNALIRGFSGDIVVILLIYFFMKGLYDFNSVKLGIFVLLLAYCTEFLQFLDITTLLGLEDSKLVQLILGAVFDPLDLAAYTIGAILAVYIDKRLLKRVFL